MALLQANLARMEPDMERKAEHFTTGMKHFVDDWVENIKVLIKYISEKKQDETEEDSENQSEEGQGQGHQTDSGEPDSDRAQSTCVDIVFKRGQYKKLKRKRKHRKKWNEKKTDPDPSSSSDTDDEEEPKGNRQDSKESPRSNKHDKKWSSKEKKRRRQGKSQTRECKPEKEAEDEFFDYTNVWRKKDERFLRFIKLFWTYAPEFNVAAIQEFWTILAGVHEEDVEDYFRRYIGAHVVAIAEDRGLGNLKVAINSGNSQRLSKMFANIEEFINCCASKPKLFGYGFNSLLLEVKAARAIVEGLLAYTKAVKIMDASNPDGPEILNQLLFAKKTIGWKDTELSAKIAVKLATYYFLFEKKNTKAQRNLDRAFLFINAAYPDYPEEFVLHGEALDLKEKLRSHAAKNADADPSQFEDQNEDEDESDRKEKVKVLTSQYTKGFDNFVNFIFKFFPPKHVAQYFKPLAKFFPKKLLIKMVTWYHPDKVDGSKYGMAYKRDCEEISKFITQELNKEKKRHK